MDEKNFVYSDLLESTHPTAYVVETLWLGIVFQEIKVYWNRVDDELIDEWIIDDGVLSILCVRLNRSYTAPQGTTVIR